MDIASFLRTYPPFDQIDDEHLERLVRATRIEFHGSGDVILRQGGEPAEAMYVVRKGAVELDDDEQVIDLLAEGEIFGHTSMLSDVSPSFTCRAHEDTILYLIAPHEAQLLLGTHSGLAFLSSSPRRRLVREGPELCSVPICALLTLRLLNWSVKLEIRRSYGASPHTPESKYVYREQACGSGARYPGHDAARARHVPDTRRSS